MNLSNRKTYIILFIILVLSFTINIATFRSGHNWNNIDFVDYLNQTKSLVNGTLDELSAMDRYLSENSTRNMGGSIGPWGFPLLLSPVYYLFGLNIYWMKVVVSIFFILSLLSVFLIFRERLDNLHNLLLVSIIAFNPWFFNFKENVLSDVPFMFFSTFSLFLIQRFVISKKIWINNFVSYSLIGIFIFVSYQTRAVGILLLPALLAAKLVEGRASSSNRPALVGIPALLPYILFMLLTFIFMNVLPKGAMTAYLDLVMNKDFSKLIPDFLYLAVAPSRFFPFLYLNMNVYGFTYNKFSVVLYALILIFVFFGMFRNRRKDYLYIIYIAFTLPVIFIFSQRGGGRLLIPLFPFLLYFLFIGLSKASVYLDISGKRVPFRINALHIFSVGMILISVLYISKTSYQNIAFNRSGSIDGPFSVESMELYGHIKAGTNKDDAIISYNPTAMILFTGRKSYALNRYYFKFDQLLDSRADYLAYNKKMNPYLLTTQELRKNFDCTFENETYILCSLKKNSKI